MWAKIWRKGYVNLSNLTSVWAVHCWERSVTFFQQLWCLPGESGKRWLLHIAHSGVHNRALVMSLQGHQDPLLQHIAVKPLLLLEHKWKGFVSLLLKVHFLAAFLLLTKASIQEAKGQRCPPWPATGARAHCQGRCQSLLRIPGSLIRREEELVAAVANYLIAYSAANLWNLSHKALQSLIQRGPNTLLSEAVIISYKMVYFSCSGRLSAKCLCVNKHRSTTVQFKSYWTRSRVFFFSFACFHSVCV